MASSYAIVESGGKQYRAEKGESLVVERLPEDEGAKVSLRAVAYLGDKDLKVAAKELEKVKVEAVVTEHLRGPKVRIFKYKPKKGYRRRGGHRQGLTRLEVTEVRLLTRRPAQKPAEKAKSAEKAEPEEKRAAAKRPAPKKEAAQAKKPAAKKPAAKKPATGRGSSSGSRAGRGSSASRRSSSAKKES